MSRPPQIDLKALLAQPNPHIDLKLQAYETSTRNFLKAVSNYKNRSVATIAERRATHTAEIKRFAEKAKAVEDETKACKIKEIELAEELEREAGDRKEAEAVVANLKRQLATINEKCASIDVEIEQYRAITANLRRDKQKEQATLTLFGSRVAPTVDTLQSKLGCVIEGVEKDQILVRFTSIDKADPEREFTFVLDVSGSSYRVLTSSPALRSLSPLITELNETRDLNAFIIQMRQEYVKSVSDMPV